MSLFMKLLKVQDHVLGLKKDKKSFSYSYVTGDKLIGFIKPIMNEQKLLLKQEVVKVEKEQIDYTTKKGEAKSEILYSVWQKFTWIDCETGEKDVNEFFACGMNEWEKGLGSALTYAERYFLLKYFHIATDEDDIDNDKRKEDFAKTKPFNGYSRENAIELVNKQDKEVITKIMDFYKVFEIEEIEEEELKKLFKKYNK